MQGQARGSGFSVEAERSLGTDAPDDAAVSGHQPRRAGARLTAARRISTFRTARALHRGAPRPAPGPRRDGRTCTGTKGMDHPRTRPAHGVGSGLTASLSLLALFAGCSPSGEVDRPARARDVAAARPAGPVMVGADVLLRDSLELVRGRRVGLITNHTGRAAARTGSGADSAVSTAMLLFDHPDLDLVALYSPEHGIEGIVREGERVASGRHAETGLPVYSLYDETNEPLPAMLEGVEVLLFDIQDVGARYYTYVWTMALALRAAGAAGIPFVVLDRPNPIGGELVQGNVLDTAFATFVGLHPVPMRHGMTAGEVARLVHAHWEPRAELHVVAMKGWKREMWYEDTGLEWVAPSPNMPSVESATHYPGTCLFEGTGLSVGRGTERPFQWVGAPWLDGEALAERLNAYGLPGVRFEAVRFTPNAPSDGKFAGSEVHGVRFVATERELYDPTRAALAAVIEARRLARALPGDPWEWNAAHFDRLAGTDRVRRLVEQGASLDSLVAAWDAQLHAFLTLRRPSLLYR